MTHDEFVKKYTGKFVEAGGSANALNQCVDLANAYLDEVLKQPKVLWTNAVDFPERINSSFEFIKNAPTNVPQKGDIVVWSEGIGKYGHIGIFNDGNINSFNSFDQNFPIGTSAHMQNHTYKNVRGWLRYKGGEGTMKPDEMILKKTIFEELVAKSTTRDEVVKSLGLPDDSSKETILKSIAGIKGDAGMLRTRVAELEQEVVNRKEQVSRLEQGLTDKDKLIDTLRKELSTGTKPLHDRIALLEGQVDTIAKEKGTCLTELAKCQSGITNEAAFEKVIKWIKRLLQ